MNMKKAGQQLAEAKGLLEQARDLLAQDNLTDAQREEAASLRERARKMRNDAEVMAEIEREAKSLTDFAAPAADEGAETGFKSFGEWLVAAYEAKSTGRRDPRLVWMAQDPEDVRLSQKRGKKALSGQEGATGGFLIPENFVARLQTVMVDSSPVLARTMRMPMSSRTVTLPVLDFTQSLAAGEPRQFGGSIAYYQDEGDSSEESEPKFRDFTLTAHELVVYTEANNSLLSDSAISLEAFLQSEMGMMGTLMWKVDYKIFQGTGVGQPQGILTADCTIGVNRDSADLIQYDDVVNMDNSIIPSPRLAWFATLKSKAQLRKLKDDADNLIWSEPANGLPPTLLGYPIYFTDKLPALGDTGDIVLADMGYYAFGDRQAPTLDISTEANFRRNRTAYRLIHRHDGAPWMNAALTLPDGVSTVSPFVVLNESSAS